MGTYVVRWNTKGEQWPRASGYPFMPIGRPEQDILALKLPCVSRQD